MKKYLQIVALVLVMAMSVVVLTACNSYPNILKAFEDEGFSESSAVEQLAESLKAELEEDEFAINVHVLYKALYGTAIIIEFTATQDMKDAIAENEELQTQLKNVVENEDVQDLYDDAVEKGIVNGNCVLIPVSLLGHTQDIIDIFKNA